MGEPETYRTADGETHLMPVHECTDGWISDDPPTPCLVCRPHLRRRRGDVTDSGLRGWTAKRNRSTDRRT